MMCTHRAVERRIRDRARTDLMGHRLEAIDEENLGRYEMETNVSKEPRPSRLYH